MTGNYTIGQLAERLMIPEEWVRKMLHDAHVQVNELEIKPEEKLKRTDLIELAVSQAGKRAGLIVADILVEEWDNYEHNKN